MTKQQIIHHISKRLEFLLNHSDGADRNLNADKITELSALLRDVTMEDNENPTPMGNTFTYSSPDDFSTRSSGLRGEASDEPMFRVGQDIAPIGRSPITRRVESGSMLADMTGGVTSSGTVNAL